jgi:hypothetical protein
MEKKGRREGCAEEEKNKWDERSDSAADLEKLTQA